MFVDQQHITTTSQQAHATGLPGLKLEVRHGRVTTAHSMAALPPTITQESINTSTLQVSRVCALSLADSLFWASEISLCLRCGMELRGVLLM